MGRRSVGRRSVGRKEVGRKEVGGKEVGGHTTARSSWEGETSAASTPPTYLPLLPTYPPTHLENVKHLLFIKLIIEAELKRYLIITIH